MIKIEHWPEHRKKLEKITLKSNYVHNMMKLTENQVQIPSILYGVQMALLDSQHKGRHMEVNCRPLWSIELFGRFAFEYRNKKWTFYRFHPLTVSTNQVNIDSSSKE